jgi:internalin A
MASPEQTAAAAFAEARRLIEEAKQEGSRKLNLAGLGLTSLPSEIAELERLRQLNLTNNHLRYLPETLYRLLELEDLFLADNLLSVLSPEIGRLTKLKAFSLSRNQLTSLPREIKNLSNLETLWVADNQLTELPIELRSIPSLRAFGVERNPALELPVEVTGQRTTWDSQNAQRILDFYFSRREQGEAPIREVRVLFVGRGRVGKTSLIKALQGKKPDAQERETPGITVHPLALRCQRGHARGHTWDFGGQEFLHGTHQIFLSERCVYVLVLEGRDSNWEIETDYWLRFIQSYGGASPVIVALNKYAAHPFSVDRFRLRERCPQIVGFIETDAFGPLGVTELHALLADTVNGMDHVWAGVPKIWHRVKEELTRMPQSFLEYRDYQALCAKLGVGDEEPQSSLAETLHRLGIALNFRDHHRLRHTSVLKPQWVTEGIYGVLRYTQKRDSHGMLERRWLKEALPLGDYPPDKHAFVLGLMEKFEVAFALEARAKAPSPPVEPERWLIPELLPEVQPAPFDEFRGPGVRRVRFSYPEALPPGLLPRLIVRTHEMSDKHAEWRWRSGAVLEWGDCRALVRLDRSERRTEIAVLGGREDDRQSLFDIIRAHLSVLHGSVPFVEEVQALETPPKWVPMVDLRMAERDEDETLKVTVGKDPDTQRVKLRVVQTLNTVESEAARKASGPSADRRMQLFISYAHQNEKELTPFRQHLTLLSQQGYIQVWQDRDLVAGEQWETGIREALGRAEIVLVFYTTGARVSTFIQETELPMALARSDAGECTVIWVPLERNDLDPQHPLEKRLKALQCATRDAQPIYEFEIVPKGWLQVEQSIRRAVEKRRTARAGL